VFEEVNTAAPVCAFGDDDTDRVGFERQPAHLIEGPLGMKQVEALAPSVEIVVQHPRIEAAPSVDIDPRLQVRWTEAALQDRQQ
jgi:hypothetical protein